MIGLGRDFPYIAPSNTNEPLPPNEQWIPPNWWLPLVLVGGTLWSIISRWIKEK
jgi:hypothetical protein